MQAGYGTNAQYDGLLFHYHAIAPALGPPPTVDGDPAIWESFMTDDFSPMEFSWSWNTGGPKSKPKIRYTVEAIGAKAGSAVDPYNRAGSLELIAKLQSIMPNLDWQCFDHLLYESQPHLNNPAHPHITPPGSNRSSMFLGFEFQENGIGVKTYLAPTKATLTGQTPLQVITESIRSLERIANITFPAYDKILNFLTHDHEGSSLEVLGIAPDCVDPGTARLKLYVRSHCTSFDSVRHVMRMGICPAVSSQIDDDTGDVMTDLFDLWRSILACPADSTSTEQLPQVDHPTAGILYNFEIRPGMADAEPKLYIPVKHYGTNDSTIAEGLVGWLREKGRGEWCTAYLSMLEGLVCNCRDLGEGRGVQTYVQCGIMGGKIALTSYLAPEIYRRTKWTE